VLVLDCDIGISLSESLSSAQTLDLSEKDVCFLKDDVPLAEAFVLVDVELVWHCLVGT